MDQESQDQTPVRQERKDIAWVTLLWDHDQNIVPRTLNPLP